LKRGGWTHSLMLLIIVLTGTMKQHFKMINGEERMVSEGTCGINNMVLIIDLVGMEKKINILMEIVKPLGGRNEVFGRMESGFLLESRMS
jgi:hypothetical protein